MNQTERKRMPLWLCLVLTYAGVFALSVLLQDNLNGAWQVLLPLAVALGGLAAWTVWHLAHKTMTLRRWVTLFLLAGVAVRLACMLLINEQTFQHDVEAAEWKANGHYGYILYLMRALRPADPNYREYYHPPFYYMCSAATLLAVEKLGTVLPTIRDLFSHVQIVSCFASCGTLLLMPRLAKAAGLSERAQLVATAVVAVQPSFALFMAVSGNNDSLLWLLCGLTLYATLRWDSHRSLGRILQLALALGLAMMTKVSAGLLAVPIAGLFAVRLWQAVHAKKAGPLVQQFVGFALLVFPLGLWHPVWRLIHYGQPFTYVPSTDYLSTAGRTLAERFGWNWQYFATPYFVIDGPNRWNLPEGLIKTSVFGEFAFPLPDVLAYALLAMNAAVMLAAFAAMLWLLVRGKGANPVLRFVFPATYLLQLASYIGFYAQMPASCSMDARYVLVNLVLGALFLGAAVSGRRKQ